MPTPQQQKHNREVISAQGQLDNAPTTGKRGTYLKLPQGISYFKPQAGQDYKLIFLPWKAGKFNRGAKEGTWATNLYLDVHRQIGPNEESFICVQRRKGQPCAVCAGFAKLRSGGADWDAIKDLRSKDRELFLIHDTEGPRDNIMVWEESIHLFGDFFRNKYKRKPQWLTYADFHQGKLIIVSGKEKKIGTNKCVEFPLVEIEDREQPLSEVIIKKCQTLCPDNWVIEVPQAKLAELFAATGGGEEEDEVVADEEQEEEQVVEGNGEAMEYEEAVPEEEEVVPEEEPVYEDEAPVDEGEDPVPEEEEVAAEEEEEIIEEEEEMIEEPVPEPTPPRRPAPKPAPAKPPVGPVHKPAPRPAPKPAPKPAPVAAGKAGNSRPAAKTPPKPSGKRPAGK